MSKNAVFCLTNSRDCADRIIDRLHFSGFPYSEISVLLPETDLEHDILHVKSSKASEGVTTGATTGGIVGGAIALLVGVGALAIPGIGMFIAAGPIMAALSGAALGAATGGIVGGLIGLGIPEIEAKIYDAKLRVGHFLISVHTQNSDEVERAKAIYTVEGAEEISTLREAAVPEA